MTSPPPDLRDFGAQAIDPRDARWEEAAHALRVDVWSRDSPRSMWNQDTYRMDPASMLHLLQSESLHESSELRAYVVWAEVVRPDDGLGLVRLWGREPTAED
ncbi:hypothetical protein GCM10027194_32920 [Thalassiella azotivora]